MDVSVQRITRKSVMVEFSARDAILLLEAQIASRSPGQNPPFYRASPWHGTDLPFSNGHLLFTDHF
jgi:hypothetical protein